MKGKNDVATPRLKRLLVLLVALLVAIFSSASASNSRVEFTLQVVHPGTVELSIGATGEVRVDYGDGSGAWSWGGATSDSIAILAVSVVSTRDSPERNGYGS